MDNHNAGNLFGDNVCGYSTPSRQTSLVDGGEYERHMLVCTDPAADSCLEKGAQHVKTQLTATLDDHRKDDVKVSPVRSLGFCNRGPIAVVYPNGIWYDHLTPAKARYIARQHLVNGQPVREFTFDPDLPPDHTHILVCTFLSACGPQGGGEALRYFRDRAEGRPDVTVTNAHGCLWDCSMGPIAVVYPSGNWYGRLVCYKYEDVWEDEVVTGGESRFVSGKTGPQSDIDS